MLHAAIIFPRYFMCFALVAITMLAFISPAFAGKMEDDLVYQAALGKVDDVDKLLAKGASPDAKDEKGTPALNLAAARTDDQALKITKALLESGANINARDARLQTPIMQAIVSQNTKLVHYLLSNGADFYAVDIEGRSVKKLSEWIGNPQIKALVEKAFVLKEEYEEYRISKERMYKLLDQYIYYNCALQYLVQAHSLKLLKDMDQQTYHKRSKQVEAVITHAHTELAYSFRMPSDDIVRMGEQARKILLDEIGIYSGSSARRAGIGNEEDLDRRCKGQLSGWRKSFEEAERQRLLQEHRKEKQEYEKEQRQYQRERHEEELKRREELQKQKYEEYYNQSIEVE